MDREKTVNLAWVLVLVPLVLSIFKLIRYAGFQEVDNWLLIMLGIALLMAVLLAVPRLTVLIYDYFSNIN